MRVVTKARLMDHQTERIPEDTDRPESLFGELTLDLKKDLKRIGGSAKPVREVKTDLGSMTTGVIHSPRNVFICLNWLRDNVPYTMK